MLFLIQILFFSYVVRVLNYDWWEFFSFDFYHCLMFIKIVGDQKTTKSIKMPNELNKKLSRGKTRITFNFSLVSDLVAQKFILLFLSDFKIVSA